MNRISVELVKSKLRETDEVKKSTVAKLKLRNKNKREIKNPASSGLERSRRYDQITQVVQDSSFTADVKPAGGNQDLVPQADFAEVYTDKMEHGKTGGMGGNGENQKSPKAVGTTGMKPNQTTKLKKVGDQWGKVQRTEDDGEQDIFSIPQADYAETYTDKMPHGSKNVDFNTENKGAPSRVSHKKMDGGPTRVGGKRNAKLGGDVVGSVEKDKQNIQQVGSPGEEASKSDALKWRDQLGTKKETHGATNVYEGVESGVVVTLNGKRKAAFEVVSRSVLNKMAESYGKYGYNVEFIRSPRVTWKSDRRFLNLLRESIHASYNHAPNFSKQLRKNAMQRFGQLCRNSYNPLYESRDEFVQTMNAAFRKIEELAENQYLDKLEFFDCLARLRVDEQLIDLEIVTQATNPMMAARQVRNKIQEEYGFDSEIAQIFIDGKKISPNKIVEYKPIKV